MKYYWFIWIIFIIFLLDLNLKGSKKITKKGVKDGPDTFFS